MSNSVTMPSLLVFGDGHAVQEPSAADPLPAELGREPSGGAFTYAHLRGNFLRGHEVSVPLGLRMSVRLAGHGQQPCQFVDLA